VARHKVYYRAKGGGFPQVRAVVSLVSLCLHVARLCTKVFQLCTNQLVVWFVQVRVNNWCLSFFLVHLGAPTRPSTLEVLRARQCTPTSFPTVVHLWTYSWVHQGAWGCVTCAARIIANPTFIGVYALIYLGLWSSFLGAPLKLCKLWFCADDMNRCIGDTNHKYALDKPVVSKIWLIQVESNLTQDQIKFLEDAWFVLNKW